MSTYIETVVDNKERIIVDCMTIINNETLNINYAIFTNLHVDYGIVDNCLGHWYGTSKKAFERKLNQFKKHTGKRLKLHKVDNDSTYTRLTYRLK